MYTASITRLQRNIAFSRCPNHFYASVMLQGITKIAANNRSAREITHFRAVHYVYTFVLILNCFSVGNYRGLLPLGLARILQHVKEPQWVALSSAINRGQMYSGFLYLQISEQLFFACPQK